MPLGEIKSRELTAKEKRWLAKWKKWEGSPLIDHLPDLRRMSQAEYRAFTYTMDPRQALIFSMEPGFREIREYQLSKRWYHEWRDTVCRLLNL